MKIFKIILIVWIALWVFFIAKSLVTEKDKSTLKEYVSLVCADQEGKRAIVFGRDFYEFLKFCKANLPSGSGYEITGIPLDSVDLPRLIYYLYPSLNNSNPDYILVYKRPGFSKEGAYLYASLDKESFILRYK